MTVAAWFAEQFPEVVSAHLLKHSQAIKLAILLSSRGYGGATLTECRRSPNSRDEALIVEADSRLGQRPVVNDVRSREPIALCFGEENTLPQAFPLREEFPGDVPHLNVALSGHPRSICLYDALPHEVRITFTVLRFIERIRWWLNETAYGRLHGDGQPLDPIFHQAGISLVLPSDFLTHPQNAYVAMRVSSRPMSPLLLEAVTRENMSRGDGQTNQFTVISLVTVAIAHGRMRILPRNLEELLSTYQSLGINLHRSLSDAFANLLAVAGHAELLKRHLLLLLTTPLTRDGVSGSSELVSTKAFATPFDSSGKVAEALGSLLGANGQWARPLVVPAQSDIDLGSIGILPADVYERFSRAMARKSAGRPAISTDPDIALIGAGALGSQLALTAARMGYGRWTIIDKDFLLPHNLARHALGPWHLGCAKADRLALEIDALLGTGAATAVVVDVLAPDEDNQEWAAVLRSMDFVVDASASVPVARWLAIDAERTRLAASCFLNPSGTDAVVLSEGRDRQPRLDQLEMSYYWRLVTEESLSGHLQRADSAFSLGACRTPSAQIPQTRVSCLAALVTDIVCTESWRAAGQIVLWRSSERGIARHDFAGELFVSGQLGDWTVSVRAPLLAAIEGDRGRAGGLETGGILAGTWDRDRKIIYLVGHFDPPPDSQHEPTGFVRGMVGVHRTIMQIETSTAGNLTYIGEWHTHPQGHISAPSSEDEYLLRWVHDALQWSDAPALILIAADDGYRIILLQDRSERSELLIAPPSIV
jgi:Prokaryotic E2 family A/ThiF family/Prokaryotic homologs of the JAB domain